MPFVALATVYVYFDARVRSELGRSAAAELPAEIALCGDDARRRARRRLDVALEPTRRRIARWAERARVLRRASRRARADHASVDVRFSVFERDSAIGGGLLAGALAYRSSSCCSRRAPVRLRPRAVRRTRRPEPEQVAKDAGLHGLIASQVASTRIERRALAGLHR